MKSEGYWILGNPTISAVTNDCTDWGLSENSSHVYHIAMIFVVTGIKMGRDKIGAGDG